MFALVGALFVLTQSLQFNLGYTPLQAGVRMLPIAAALAVVAPLSAQLVRRIGAKMVTAGGLAFVAAGLWQVSGASVQWTYTDLLPGLVMTGIGAALVLPTVSGAVMGSVPRGDTAVAAATNGTFIQVGGAMGVAVIGSVLSSRYQERMSAALTHVSIPTAVRHSILSSIGGALTVATQAARPPCHAPRHRGAFRVRRRRICRLTVGAAVTVAGCIVALIIMPTRLPDQAPPALDREVSNGGPDSPSRPVHDDSLAETNSALDGQHPVAHGIRIRTE
jgi:MFS family permease